MEVQVACLLLKNILDPLWKGLTALCRRFKWMPPIVVVKAWPLEVSSRMAIQKAWQAQTRWLEASLEAPSSWDMSEEGIFKEANSWDYATWRIREGETFLAAEREWPGEAPWWLRHFYPSQAPGVPCVHDTSFPLWAVSTCIHFLGPQQYSHC